MSDESEKNENENEDEKSESDDGKGDDDKRSLGKAILESILAKSATSDEPLSIDSVKAAIEEATGAKGKAASTADLLVELAKARAELFHDAQGTAYATVLIDGVPETMKIRSSRFTSWLQREYYLAFEKVP